MLNREARKHPIMFMTRRDGPGAWQETSSWLHRYGIDEPLVYCIKPGEEKGAVCKRMGIKVIIDDSHKYAPELINNGVTVIMPRYPYNSKFLNEWKQPNILRIGQSMLYEVKDLQEGLIAANVLLNKVK